MTIGDKIKGAFSKDSSDNHVQNISGPLTGPDAYTPMSNAAHGRTPPGSTGGSFRSSGTGQQLTGDLPSSGYHAHTGSGTGAGLGNSYGNNQSNIGTGNGTGSGHGTGSGVGTGSGIGSGGRTMAHQSGGQYGDFSQGYSEDEPGYSERFGSGKPVYRENIQEGRDGSWSADLSAQGGTQEWQRARELTLAAEREAAAATLSGNKAQHELAAAEHAERAVCQAQAKHREALMEAEKYRSQIGDPTSMEAGVSDAKELYRQKQTALIEAERILRDAEADLAGRRRDHEKLHPQVERYGQKLPGLEDEYVRRQREREQVEGAREKYLLSAEEASRNREGFAADLNAVSTEFERSDRHAHLKQQEYIEARNAAQSIAQQVANLKGKLREIDGIMSGHRSRANRAEQNLPSYREAEERALRELEDSKNEWYRLRELEDDYTRAYKDAANRLQSMQGTTDPASRELKNARGLLSSRQEDLDRARQRAMEAESKYNHMLSLADRHKHFGDSAADAAHQHGEKYEAAKREAHIHGDKHVEYWNEAKTHGETGSSEATSAVKKLEEKVRGLLNRNEA